MSTVQSYDVIVIGCGASGIAALSKLYQSKFSVLGLEASSRIGGRIHSMQYGNGHIDFGAEFCHGQEDNIVYTLAKDHNVIFEPKEDYVLDFAFSNGNCVSKELRYQIDGIIKEVSVLAKEEMENSPETVGTLLTKKFWELLPKYNMIDEALGKKVLEIFEKFENSIDGSDNWHESSAKGLLQYWECDGYSLCYWKNNGYQSILDILLKKYPNPIEELPINILFNKKVESIDWSDANIKVKCSDGSHYTSKHVIVTVSLGFLKENYASLFTPQLPLTKINAINGLAYGTVNKIFLKYDKPWWPSDTQIFGFIWNDEEKNKIPPEDKWIIDVYGFHSPSSNDTVLCFWITGPSSRYMETLPLDYVKKCIDGLVEQFLSEKFKTCNSVDIMRSSWYSNPLTRGSYSFRSMKTENLQTDQTQLSSPLCDLNNKPKICFAGEATSTHYYSTVHGAIEAGFREADRLTQFYKTKKLKSLL